MKSWSSLAVAGLLSISLTGCALLPGVGGQLPGQVPGASNPDAASQAGHPGGLAPGETPAELKDAPWQSGKVYLIDRVYTLPAKVSSFEKPWQLMAGVDALPGGASIDDGSQSPATLIHGGEGVSFGTAVRNDSLESASQNDWTIARVGFPPVSQPSDSLKEDRFILPKGVRIGTPEADVIKAYGQPTTRKGNSLIWTDGAAALNVLIKNGVMWGAIYGDNSNPKAIYDLWEASKKLASKDPKSGALVLQGKPLRLERTMPEIEALGWTPIAEDRAAFEGAVGSGEKVKVRFENPSFRGLLELGAGNRLGSPTKWKETPIVDFSLAFVKPEPVVGYRRTDAVFYMPGGFTVGTPRATVEKRAGKPMFQRKLGNITMYGYAWGKQTLNISFKNDLAQTLQYALLK